VVWSCLFTISDPYCTVVCCTYVTASECAEQALDPWMMRNVRCFELIALIAAVPRPPFDDSLELLPSPFPPHFLSSVSWPCCHCPGSSCCATCCAACCASSTSIIPHTVVCHLLLVFPSPNLFPSHLPLLAVLLAVAAKDDSQPELSLSFTRSRLAGRRGDLGAGGGRGRWGRGMDLQGRWRAVAGSAPASTHA
jgi:hypothetical protein